MDLKDYIKVKYNGNSNWFVEEFNSFENIERVQDTQEIRNYLSGQHAILNRPNYKYNGEVIEPRRIVIQMAKTILNFKTQYLLKNPVQLIGDNSMIKKFLKVNKLSRFDDKNETILNHMLKYGEVAEYLFINNKGRIESKLIDADNGIPVYNRYGDLIAFIERYLFDGITYWTVYSETVVEEWSNVGGQVTREGSHINISGLPIIYRVQDEQGTKQGYRELNDYVGILNNLEDIISKYTDSFYKFINPVPIIAGQQLKTSLPSEIVGGGINLDDGSTFSFESGQLDSKSFESLYKTLQQTLLDVSSTPAVSMNKTDISNLSEVSIKLLFSLADTAAGTYENFLLEGFYVRWEKIIKLLSMRGVKVNDDQLSTLDFKFNYNTPANHKEIIENMKVQYEMGAISTETILEQSPYVVDVGEELFRLDGQNLERVDPSAVLRQPKVEEVVV